MTDHDYYQTVTGLVYLRPRKPGTWEVLKKNGDRVLGKIEIAGSNGTYVATAKSGLAQQCPNLLAAIKVVGASS